jgi:hypothetical protein
MSVAGTSRQFAATQHFGRFRTEARIGLSRAYRNRFFEDTSWCALVEPRAPPRQNMRFPGILLPIVTFSKTRPEAPRPLLGFRRLGSLLAPWRLVPGGCGLLALCDVVHTQRRASLVTDKEKQSAMNSGNSRKREGHHASYAALRLWPPGVRSPI